MTRTQATVLLHILGVQDPFPCRSLTFTPDTDRVEIGRASKREIKNLTPSRQNALFESRVMSRTHAILRVSLEKKLLYICDPGSMHGTWLNEEKLPVDKDIELSNGDVLTFGVEVVRGADTFPPLAVRCECHWLEKQYVDVCQTHHKHTKLDRSNDLPQKQHQTSNTFCVPEEDEEEYDDQAENNDCKTTSHNPVSFGLTGDQSSEMGSSSVGSISEDSRSVIEVQSFTTSPIIIGVIKDSDTDEDPSIPADLLSPNPVEQSNEDSEDSEQPLATPIMTPPSVSYESDDPHGDNQYYDEYFAHGSDEEEESNVDSEDWAINEELDEAADGAMLEPFNINVHFPKETLRNTADSVPVAHETVNAEPLPHDDYKEVASTPKPTSLPSAKQLPSDILGAWSVPPVLAGVPSSEINRLPEIRLAGAPFQQTEHPTSGISCTPPPRLPPLYPVFERLVSDTEPSFQQVNLSDRFAAATSTHSYTPLSADANKATSYPQFASLNTSSQVSSTHYKDGPFASAKPIVSGPTDVTAVSDSSKSGLLPFMDPMAPMIPRMSCDVLPGSDSENLRQIEQWNTSSPNSGKASTKKRKATEMEIESAEVAKTIESSEEKTGLTSIQEQYVSTTVDHQSAQITALNPSEVSKEVERPIKRAKASRTTSLKSHATTAILGAVVGAVGTIAALASLPPDYFA
ncbi:hypothetical protein BJX64DRAFT_174612 [Aspergillus heterothallicus]